jgi:tyrosyl-tRNA synthetase
MNTNVFQEFSWRAMIYDATEDLAEVLAREKVTAYIGFDPTAGSLHVGSLLPVMALARLQRFGHSPIAIVGGGTGLIGDPSGKAQERALLTEEQVDENLRGIRAQLSRFLDFDAAGNPARIVNNADWLRPLEVMPFLRDIGKNFTVNYMLAKESVKRRLDQEEGISFTEFSYLLLQAYDFLVLYDRYACTLQLGGSDQWGNITAGCDLIRKARGARAHGLVLPLVTTASGVKFGKTEAGTVWLDPALTSPFEFYQFWFNTDDRDAITYLKYFTFLDADAIRAFEQELARAPEQREAQRTLAREVTLLVHGIDGLAQAERESALKFGRNPLEARLEEVLRVSDSADAEIFDLQIDEDDLGPDGMPVTRLAVQAGLESSMSAAVRLIRGGGLYLNDERVTNERERVTVDKALDGGILRLRKGQRERRLVRVRKKS